jgi:2-methylcitrate dehydratase PrpD
MNERNGRSGVGHGFTARVGAEVRAIEFDDLSPNVVERTRHALLDWLGVTIAGAREPSARIAQRLVFAEGGTPVATLIGIGDRTTASQAAFANAIAGHALDYDDSGYGHPSSPILSAVIALAEELDAGGRAVIEAAVGGYQGMACMALASSRSSYLRGFHTTGTWGTFGAASACGRLFDLDAVTLERALGLAATQAAGLKASFGTMGKHLNAAKAAVNGLLAARLAKEGFTGATDAIESGQGFEAAHNTSPTDFDPSRLEGEARLGVERIMFKRYASCAGTHATIDAITRLRVQRPFAVEDIDHVELVVSDQVLGMCGIPEPVTGLEGKFSVRYAATLALSGAGASPSAFTDERVTDPTMVALRQRVDVVPVSRLRLLEAEVRIRLKGGEVLSSASNLDVIAENALLPEQWAFLTSKFVDLVSPILDVDQAHELVDLVRHFDELDSVSDLTSRTSSIHQEAQSSAVARS